MDTARPDVWMRNELVGAKHKWEELVVIQAPDPMRPCRLQPA